MDYLNHDYIQKEIWWCIEHEEECHQLCFSKETKHELKYLICHLVYFERGKK
jgi:hypothetical protein